MSASLLPSFKIRLDTNHRKIHTRQPSGAVAASCLSTFHEKRRPETAKPASGGPVQFGVNREIRCLSQDRLSPETRSDACEKYTFANGLFCADFRLLRAVYPQPRASALRSDDPIWVLRLRRKLESL